MLYIEMNGEKCPVDTEVMQRYGYRLGDTTPFTQAVIQEEILPVSNIMLPETPKITTEPMSAY